MKLKIGDKIRIISGKFKGLEGDISAFRKKKERVIIKGINIVKVHQKPSQSNPDGGIFEKEASIHISNVSLPSKTKVALKKTLKPKKTSAKKEKVKEVK